MKLKNTLLIPATTASSPTSSGAAQSYLRSACAARKRACNMMVAIEKDGYAQT